MQLKRNIKLKLNIDGDIKKKRMACNYRRSLYGITLANRQKKKLFGS
jgi:hypothetical protein